MTLSGPLIVIVGPTAVGKTALSLSLAERFQGEIVSADAMQIYRGMDIGTAKVETEIQKRIPHHLIDLVHPREPYTVKQYQDDALRVIADLYARNKLPIVVGGSGLYVSALVYYPDYHFQAHAPRLPVRERKKSPFKLMMIGLTMNREELYKRIDARVEAMMRMGLLDEVRSLLQEGVPPQAQSMQALGYKELVPVVRGERGLEEAVQLIKKRTRHYAKRQFTWFRSLSDVKWYEMDETKTDRTLQKISEDVAGFLKTTSNTFS
ncbi:MAG: tRNA dimethylallyltransferase [Candidatus Carbobacillus altaicus]|uniref:tRNA dimethylallyltransferase n=1 Tax=Candidatus Carbonibacillus altaicus TaxID=2163959 RepID=A0A2R6XZ98_9BACL|nr:MAG: tRNA dimethylallyltransferase [Candidatus Carbobacillus altaicus]